MRDNYTPGQSNFMRCIYCDALPNDDNPLTKEHVVPDSLGGPITIGNACKRCNSKLGEGADANLVNHWLVSFARFSLGVRNKNGIVPNPFKTTAKLIDAPEQEARIHTTRDGKIQKLHLIARKETIVDPSIDGGKTFRLTVDGSEKKNLPQMVNKILKRMGMDQRPSEEIMMAAEHHQLESPEVKVPITFDLVRYQQGLLKIALAFFSYHSDLVEGSAANGLREAIFAQEVPPDGQDYLTWHNIVGNAGLFTDTLKQCTNFVFSMWSEAPQNHVLVLQQQEEGICCLVRIFSIFYCAVLVSPGGHLKTRNAIGTVIDPTTRNAYNRTWSEIEAEALENPEKLQRIVEQARAINTPEG